MNSLFLAPACTRREFNALSWPVSGIQQTGTRLANLWFSAVGSLRGPSARVRSFQEVESSGRTRRPGIACVLIDRVGWAVSVSGPGLMEKGK